MLSPDQKIGRYLISSAIGAGGMGEVYLARDGELERSVALKILPQDISDDTERIQRFIQEAKVVSALNHPNILTIHEIGSEDGIHFIASEYVEGRTLKQIIQREGLELKDALEIAVQMASALENAHRKNIVHRDIKPENIMVRDDGVVKVLDFGIAKLLRAESEAVDKEAETRARVQTKSGTILGTINYMSPEQARGLATIDGRTDIWSLGVVIFEMLSRRLPFDGESAYDTIASILKAETPRLSDYYDECPLELERIVQKSLQKNRDERYQGARDLALDLKSLGKDLDSSGRLFTRTDAFARGSTAEYERNRLNTGGQTGGATVQGVSKYPVAVLVLATLLVALIAAMGVWYFAPFYRSEQQPGSSSTLKSTDVVSWASTPGEVYSIGSFSPDAKMIAFTSTKTGKNNIWIKQTTSGEAIQITKDEFRNEQPIWSPTGEELAFYSTRGNQSGFWRIPVLGGAPKLISAIDDGSSRLRLWSKTGLIYYESKGELFSIDSNTGQMQPFTELAARGISASSLSPSPDEKRIAYDVTEGETSSLWITGIEGNPPLQLRSSTTERIRNIAWHPDNKRIFYSGLVDGTFQIFVTDIHGAPPRRISSFEQDSLVLDVSSDGTKLLFGSAKEESDIWGVSLKDNKEFTVASDLDSELWPDVSPDGKTLVYQSIKNLSQGNNLVSGKILTKSLGTEEQPVEILQNGYLPKWSPDGKTIAIARFVGTNHQIATVNSAGGEVKALVGDGIPSVSYSLLPNDRTQTSDFSWSLDGRKIAYLSSKSGQRNIWTINTDGTNDMKITDNSDPKQRLYCPLWSPDGSSIAFTNKIESATGLEKYAVSVINVETKKIALNLGENPFIRLVGWLQSENKLVLASSQTAPSENLQLEVSLLAVEVNTGKISQLTKLNDTYLYNICLSPDKKTIAFASHRDGKDNVWTMPSTGGEAKRITNNNDSRLYFSSMGWSPDSGSIYFGKQSRFSLLSILTNFN